MKKVGLVGCVKTKRKDSALAKNLYTSPLFRYRREYVERCYDSWVILSAKHYVLLPDTVIESYDVSLKEQSNNERKRWAEIVFSQLQRMFAGPDRFEFYFHTGAEYRHELSKLLTRHRYRWYNPLEGLAFGNQLSWYKTQQKYGKC